MERSACKDARPAPRPELSAQAGPGKAGQDRKPGEAPKAPKPDRKFIHRYDVRICPQNPHNSTLLAVTKLILCMQGFFDAENDFNIPETLKLPIGSVFTISIFVIFHMFLFLARATLVLTHFSLQQEVASLRPASNQCNRAQQKNHSSGDH